MTGAPVSTVLLTDEQVTTYLCYCAQGAGTALQDHIAAQAAEIKELEQYRNWAAPQVIHYGELQVKLSAVSAERDRMREALNDIRNLHPAKDIEHPGAIHRAVVIGICDAALATKEGP